MRNASIEISSDGLFVISGKTIKSGYMADEQHTADVLRNGKIYADNLGYVDNLGLIHIIGRRDDIINVGGYMRILEKCILYDLSTCLYAKYGIKNLIRLAFISRFFC